MQAPPGPQVLVQALASPQSPRGSTPTGAAVHRPGAKGRAQEWQALSQAESQQTPSTQKPLGHSLPLVHAWTSPLAMGAPGEPEDFGVQAPSMQMPYEQGLPFGLRGAVQVAVSFTQTPAK